MQDGSGTISLDELKMIFAGIDASNEIWEKVLEQAHIEKKGEV